MYNVSLVPFDSFNGKPIFKYIYLPKLVLIKQFETQFARLYCLQKSSLNIIFKLFKIHYLSSRCLFFPQKAFRFIKYDGPHRPLFSSTISFFLVQRFRISQIVFGILKQFCYMSGTSRKSEIEFVEISKLSSNKLSKVLNSSHEVSNDSRNFETIFGSLKKFLELSNISWKFQKVVSKNS